MSLAASLKNMSDKAREISREHKEHHAPERRRSDALKAPTTNPSSHINKAEDLGQVSHFKENLAVVEVKTLESLQSKIAGILRTLGYNMPGFQTFVGEEIEEGFMEFWGRLVSSLSILVTTRLHGIGDSLTETKDPLQEIIAALEVKMVVVSPFIASNSDVNQ